MLHVLRRDRYCCQHRDAHGLKCNATARRAGHAHEGAPLTALCDSHLQQGGGDAHSSTTSLS